MDSKRDIRVFKSLEEARKDGFDISESLPVLVWKRGSNGNWIMSVVRAHPRYRNA